MAAAHKPASKSAEGRIRLEVVTPQGSVLEEIVDELTATSVDGELGVLPGHLPLLAALKTGLLTFRSGTTTTSCAVGQGFVEVADDRAVLLTDRFSTKDTIDVVAARMKLKELDEQLDKWEGGIGTPEHQALVFDEQWQAALLTLFGDPPPPMRRAVKYGGKHVLLEQVESEQAPAEGDGSEEPAEPQSK